MRNMPRLLAAALVAASCTAAAAQHVAASDEAIARDVMNSLTANHVAGVSVSVERGIVTLQGTVPTLWTRQRARELALQRDVVTVVDEVAVRRGDSDDVLAHLVASRLARYAFLTIFDDADVEVYKGVVTLRGHVTMPYKSEAFADLAARVAGVQEVRNEVRTLPVSRFDDQLRYAIARRIYGHDLFAGYAVEPTPPVHIIVEHGHVTLTGVVFSEAERRIAESIARSTFGVFSVTNKLHVELEE